MNDVPAKPWIVAVWMVCCAHCFIGCSKQDEIINYTVQKPHILAKTNPPEPISNKRVDGRSLPGGVPSEKMSPARMIAAIVPHGGQTWFFKMTGDVQTVAGQMENFLALIGTLHFTESDDSKPEWTLPEGWSQQPGSGMRYATLLVDGSSPALELSVTTLTSGEGDPNAYILLNVNRWRDQMGLPPVEKGKLFSEENRSEETRQITVGNLTVTLVNLVGKSKSGSMGRPPFAPRGRPASSTSSPKLAYEIPQGWQPGKVGGMRKVAFIVTNGEEKVEITAIDLPPSGILANVNRWREQVKLEPITNEELSKQSRAIEIGTLTGVYVELVGPAEATPRETILGVIVVHAGQAWFFKLRGDVDLAEQEKERFEAFVQSVRFVVAVGAGNVE